MNVATVGGGGVPVVAGGCAYDFCEDFENPGYENSWTDSIRSGDTLDPDNDAAPAPLVGSYSLRITTADASDTYTYTDATTTLSDNKYLYAVVNFDSDGINSYRGFLGIYGASLEETCIVVLNSGDNNETALWDGAKLSSLGSTTLVDTTYHYWLEYLKGTGANGICRVYRSTNSTKPGTPDAQITDSANTRQVSKFRLSAKQNLDTVFDKIRVSSTSIGSDPE